MTKQNFHTPVVLTIFNRPHTTEKVFEVIRQVQPSKLLVIADGARANKIGEAEKCAATRRIIDRVDWDCQVLKNYSDVNLGCGKRQSTGITWVFDQVEEAIFLEDDCLPHPSFFKFCEELLNQYRDDQRIMMISGTNILGEWKSDIQSYHFSYYGGIWGWASWRRAWQYFDYEIKLWEEPEIQNRVRDVLGDPQQFNVRAKTLWETRHKKKNNESISWWGYQWSFCRLIQSGLSIVPSVNLVSNIGFGEDSTHTKSTNSDLMNVKTFEISFPLKINNFTAVDRDYDQKYFEKVKKPKRLLTRVIKKVKKYLLLLNH